MATPHISAEKGDFAKTVLMPGDPLRAKFIADTFLKDVRQVTGVRGMLGFTGTYEGRPISVMGSGMGMPSIGIYSYELYKFYDVDNIIRIGSAGSYTDKAKLFDVVSSFLFIPLGFGLELAWRYSPRMDFNLLNKSTTYTWVSWKPF